ncbi:hypothetical protein [Ferruginibacter sp.]
MKTNVPLFKAAICLTILLNACASSKNSLESHNPEADKPKESAACFVQLKDGSFKNYTTLKLVTGLFKTPHLLGDGNVVITADEIKAYQANEQYAISQKEFTDKKPSYVALEALPGFAVRIARGKINVYSLKYYNGHNATEKFFLQSGDEGQISAYSPELMNELLKDNSEAYTFFNEKTKSLAFNKKLLTSVELYNNSRYVSKN